jgi:S-adenosylmethionine-diacylglycerol 3-amino-3-carboxypropyl transferase
MVKEVNRFRDWIFKKVHTGNLVYNTCWEDPRCDRELLEFDQDSEIVMITSAGCNALDYLMDRPNRIHCIDMNPRQNALLQLKLKSFEQTDHHQLFKLFGKGVDKNIKKVYEKQLRPALPDFAQQYWDKNLNFFNGKGPRKSFYHYGTSGTFAWLAIKYLKSQKDLYRKIQQLFEAKDLEEQRQLYFKIEDSLMNKIVEWLLNRHITMCLLGVPRSQQELFVEKYDRGALGFIQECLRNVFTKLPIQENYFWKVYLDGHYSEECCPNYLKQENFDSFQEQIHKINTYNNTISGFLKANPGSYSHFILLDHQDWLASNDIPALREEWELILQNSRPGTRILLRSAASEVDFFPDFVLDALEFEKEETARTHQLDRVGTYASVYMGIVK